MLRAITLRIQSIAAVQAVCESEQSQKQRTHGNQANRYKHALTMRALQQRHTTQRTTVYTF
jgi:hypothetical protein